MKRFVYQILFPLTTAMIWGSSFVAQSESADHIGAFTFNAARCFAAFVALLLLLPLLRTRSRQLWIRLALSRLKGAWEHGCCKAWYHRYR